MSHKKRIGLFKHYLWDITAKYKSIILMQQFIKQEMNTHSLKYHMLIFLFARFYQEKTVLAEGANRSD